MKDFYIYMMTNSIGWFYYEQFSDAISAITREKGDQELAAREEK